MGVEVDRQTNFTLECFHQLGHSSRTGHAGHVLDGESVRTSRFELLGHIDVVAERVLVFLRVQKVA